MCLGNYDVKTVKMLQITLSMYLTLKTIKFVLNKNETQKKIKMSILRFH